MASKGSEYVSFVRKGLDLANAYKKKAFSVDVAESIGSNKTVNKKISEMTGEQYVDFTLKRLRMMSQYDVDMKTADGLGDGFHRFNISDRNTRLTTEHGQSRRENMTILEEAREQILKSYKQKELDYKQGRINKDDFNKEVKELVNTHQFYDPFYTQYKIIDGEKRFFSSFNYFVQEGIDPTVGEYQEAFFKNQYDLLHKELDELVSSHTDLLRDIGGIEGNGKLHWAYEYDEALSAEKNYRKLRGQMIQNFHEEEKDLRKAMQDRLVNEGIYSRDFFKKTEDGKYRLSKIETLAKVIDEIPTMRKNAAEETDLLRWSMYGAYPQKKIDAIINRIESKPVASRFGTIKHEAERLEEVPEMDELKARLDKLFEKDPHIISDKTYDRWMQKDRQTLNKSITFLEQNADSLLDREKTLKAILSTNPKKRFAGMEKLGLQSRLRLLESKDSGALDKEIAENRKKIANVYGNDFEFDKLHVKKGLIEYKADTAAKYYGTAKQAEEVGNTLSKKDGDFSKAFSNASGSEKEKIRKAAAANGQEIKDDIVLIDGSRYYYRVDENGNRIDKLSPEAEEAIQRKEERARKKERRKNEKEQQAQGAEQGVRHHEIYTPKASSAIKDKMNPANSVQGTYLTQEQIIDSLMENADNVNSEFQSEIANPAKTTLKNSLRLQEISMEGFKMQNAGTLMGTFGALTLFEASMYANNSDAELHRRRVEEERRRKKYGY